MGSQFRVVFVAVLSADLRWLRLALRGYGSYVPLYRRSRLAMTTRALESLATTPSSTNVRPVAHAFPPDLIPARGTVAKRYPGRVKRCQAQD
jgi:hypothetical protein